jgi:hypothetical protein
MSNEHGFGKDYSEVNVIFVVKKNAQCRVVARPNAMVVGPLSGSFTAHPVAHRGTDCKKLCGLPTG